MARESGNGPTDEILVSVYRIIYAIDDSELIVVAVLVATGATFTADISTWR